MLRLICLAVLVCASLPLAAQQKTQPTVLFPSGNYAPQPTAPVPFAEKKPLKPSDTATRFDGPSVMERCIAQCNRSAAQCNADRPSESSCRMAVAPRGKSCDATQNPRSGPIAWRRCSIAPSKAMSIAVNRTSLPACVPVPTSPVPPNERACMTTMLYHAPSTAALVVHWMLIELQVPHVLHPLDFDRREQKSPAYLALNPAGVVPTLVLEGQVMTEAAAIVLHLADLHPQAGLAPPPGTPARAAYYQWMFFCANTLQPAFRAWFYPDEPAGAEQVDAAQAQARQKLEAAWAQVDAHLQAHGPYLLGDTLSAADFLLTMLMRWSRNMPKPTDTWPALHAHAQRMKARPAFRETYRREGLTDWT